MSCAIGIDFGTSNTSVATSVKGRAEVKLSRINERSTSSVVSVQHGRISVGETGPSHTEVVENIKRIIGLSYDDRMLKRYETDFHIKLKEIDGRIKVPIFEKELRVEEIVALLLWDLTHVLKSVDKAVITVPTSFQPEQRQEIENAANIAGFRKVQLIEETTAAAVAFANAKKQHKSNTLIFQLGGGTIDVSIFKITNASITVLGRTYSSCLGGIDFDRNLLEYALRSSKMRVEDKWRRELMRLTKEVKEKLGLVGGDRIIHHNSQINIPLSKGDFREANADLLAVLDEMIDMAMRAAKLTEIEEYILIGRGCLMPYVIENIERKLGEDKRALDVDIKEAAVMGAAIYAEARSKKKIKLSDDIGAIITIDDGQVSHLLGSETRKIVDPSLPALQRVNIKNMIVKVHGVGIISRDDSHVRLVNRYVSDDTVYPVKEKKMEMTESRRIVTKLVKENKKTKKTEQRVRCLDDEVTNLKDEVEEITAFCNNTKEWIKNHRGQFENEKLVVLENELKEKRRLLVEKTAKSKWGLFAACFSACFCPFIGTDSSCQWRMQRKNRIQPMK